MAHSAEPLVRVAIAGHHAHIAILNAAHFAVLIVVERLLLVQALTSWTSSQFRRKEHSVQGFIRVQTTPYAFMPEPVTLLAEVAIAALTAVAATTLRNEVLIIRDVVIPVKVLAFALRDSALVHDHLL